jgi:hypothetical protein
MSALPKPIGCLVESDGNVITVTSDHDFERKLLERRKIVRAIARFAKKHKFRMARY